MYNKVKDVLIGATGITTSEIAPAVVENVAQDSANIVNVIVQVVIGIVTLFGLFKKNKREKYLKKSKN